MTRLAGTFAGLRARGATGLVTYVTAGDPDLVRSREILLALNRAGADVIELGVPFSDPIGDGPVIQRASERALASGSHLEAALDLTRTVRREVEAPIVLFSYVNPIFRGGIDAFASRAQAAGIDGVLLVDLPIEEAGEVRESLVSRGLDLIFLVSPTTSDDRLALAARLGSGFLYAISRLGVTGARTSLAPSAGPLVARIRAVTDLPVAVGFGVSTAAHVEEVGRFADAAVVGSALVDLIGQSSAADADPSAAVEHFVRGLRGHGHG